MSSRASAGVAASSAERNARRAARSGAADKAARLGFLAQGLVYGLIGVLAIQVAFGDSQEADQQGALQAVADQPLGSVVLWLMVVGFAGYALWRFSEAAWGRRGEADEHKRAVKRIASAADGLIHLALGLLALRTVTSGASSGSGESTTAKVLNWPGGTAIVVCAGVVILVAGAGLAVRGLRTDFDKHLDRAWMDGTTFSVVRRLGQVGQTARGAVIALVGVFVIKAALEHEPGKAEGLDVALKELADAPLGTVLLPLAAAGLICFGVYGRRRIGVIPAQTAY